MFLKLKLSNTCLFYDSTKRKIQVLHKYEITLVFFVLIWFSNFENQIKTKNTSVISCLWRTCIFRLVEWKNKRVFDSLSFKTSTNFRKCLNHEIANFLDVYQDFPFVGVVFSRAIHWHFPCLLYGLDVKKNHLKQFWSFFLTNILVYVNISQGIR